jgi:hypothetical protein
MAQQVTLGALNRFPCVTLQSLQIAAGTTSTKSPEYFGPPLIFESVGEALTAAGTTQATALQLAAELNRITTCAAGAGVILPSTAITPTSGPNAGVINPGVGQTIMVINHGANSLQVYGSGSDLINDVAGATGVTQMVNSMVIYIQTVTGKWYTQGLSEGYSGSFATFSATNGIAGSTVNKSSATSVSLAAMINRTTGGADSAISVCLPASAMGLTITLLNACTGSLNVFTGNTVDVINAVASTSPYAVGSSKSVEFICANAGQWHALLSA